MSSETETFITLGRLKAILGLAFTKTLEKASSHGKDLKLYKLTKVLWCCHQRPTALSKKKEQVRQQAESDFDLDRLIIKGNGVNVRHEDRWRRSISSSNLVFFTFLSSLWKIQFWFPQITATQRPLSCRGVTRRTPARFSLLKCRKSVGRQGGEIFLSFDSFRVRHSIADDCPGVA